jgi:hypothetical protein
VRAQFLYQPLRREKISHLIDESCPSASIKMPPRGGKSARDALPFGGGDQAALCAACLGRCGWRRRCDLALAHPVRSFGQCKHPVRYTGRIGDESLANSDDPETERGEVWPVAQMGLN